MRTSWKNKLPSVKRVRSLVGTPALWGYSLAVTMACLPEADSSACDGLCGATAASGKGIELMQKALCDGHWQHSACPDGHKTVTVGAAIAPH